MKYKLTTILLTVFMVIGPACGEITDLTNNQDESPPESADENATSDETPEPAPPDSGNENNNAGGTPPTVTAIVLAANFLDPIGSITTVTTTPPRTATTGLELTYSDAVATCQNNKIYVVNRWGADNIQVINPTTFDTEGQFSTGNGTNPQDIVVINGTKAYVSLYQPDENTSDDLVVDDIIIMNPTTGEITGTIDLTPYADDDEDVNPRASAMLRYGNRLFVAMQDLQSDYSANTEGKIAVINITTNEVEEVITLSDRNPTDMAFGPGNEKIYVTESYYSLFDTTFGGVERVDVATLTSDGIVVDNTALENAPGVIEIIGNHGYVVVSSWVTGSAVYRFDLSGESEPSLVYQSNTYFQGIAKEPNQNFLWIGDRDPENTGIMIINTVGTVVDGPISVGAAPSSICFMVK